MAFIPPIDQCYVGFRPVSATQPHVDDDQADHDQVVDQLTRLKVDQFTQLKEFAYAEMSTFNFR